MKQRAGKSILLEALGLVTGKELGASCVKKGQKAILYCCLFDIEKNGNYSSQILQENALDDENLYSKKNIGQRWQVEGIL